MGADGGEACEGMDIACVDSIAAFDLSYHVILPAPRALLIHSSLGRFEGKREVRNRL